MSNFLNQGARRVLATSVAVIAMSAGLEALAVTAAGQTIQNQATATYQDATGNTYSAQSNLAVVTVQQVYSATIEEDHDRTAAAGQQVSFPHTLTNTGNGTDTYTLALTNLPGDDGDFTNLAVFHDLNGNGLADPGEPDVTGLTVTLNAGENTALVVSAIVPALANGSEVDSLLTATTANGVVTDLTASKGHDGLDGTNRDRITITDDAVLNINKSAVHDPVANTIAYTIRVTNTGQSAANDVAIFDGIPAGTTLSAGPTGSGFGANTGDIAAAAAPIDEVALSIEFNGDGDVADATEATLGIDLDRDGTQAASAVPGVYGFDDELPPNTTVTLDFTVSYDPTMFDAGDVIENVARVAGDLDGDGSVDDGVSPSNPTQTEIGQLYGVTITDTGGAASPAVNDGADDDAAANDLQQVDEAGTGATVLFTNIVTNDGNGIDTFELDFSGSTFPAGTIFQAWNGTGSTQLLNTNGTGGVDTGPMDPGESRTITVRAILPSGPSGAPAGGYDVILTATSANDPATTPANDDVTEELLEILEASADLSNNAPDGDNTLDADAYNDDGVAVTTLTGDLGDTVVFNLTIENDSTRPDSFQLDSGGTWDGSTLGALPTGWNVVFRDTGGSVISTTPSIPSLGVFNYTAEVTIPTDSTLAADVTSYAEPDLNITGTGNFSINGNGDYAVFFQVTSGSTGVSDIKLDAVDVLPFEQLTLTIDQTGEIQPGGSIDYDHNLVNEGNTPEIANLSTSDDQPGFSSNLLVNTPSGEASFATLAIGDSVIITDASGSPATVVLVDDGSGQPGVPLSPGESIPVTVRVFAPSNAANGDSNTTTLTANYNGNSANVTNLDVSTVSTAQLRLYKTAAIDNDCDGTPDTAFAVDSGQAEPDECIVWQIVARNESAELLNTVEISDAVPTYTTYEPGTMEICNGDQTAGGCPAFTGLTDAAADDEGELAGADVLFDLTVPGVTFPNGEIAPGASATVRFSTRID